MPNCTIVWYKCCPDVTIVESDITIVVPWQLSTGSKLDYLFCYCPLVGILFEVLRIESVTTIYVYVYHKICGTLSQSRLVSLFLFCRWVIWSFRPTRLPGRHVSLTSTWAMRCHCCLLGQLELESQPSPTTTWSVYRRKSKNRA